MNQDKINIFGPIKKSLRITGYKEQEEGGSEVAQQLETQLKALGNEVIKVVYRGYEKNFIEVHFVKIKDVQLGIEKIQEVEVRCGKPLKYEHVYDNEQDEIKKQTDQIDQILDSYKTPQERKQLFLELRQMALDYPQDFINMLKSYPMMDYIITELLYKINNEE